MQNEHVKKPTNTSLKLSDLSRSYHPCFICLFLFFFFFFIFFKHLKTNPRHHVTSAYRLQYLSLKSMGIFLYHHSAVNRHNTIHALHFLFHVIPHLYSKFLHCFFYWWVFKIRIQLSSTISYDSYDSELL